MNHPALQLDADDGWDLGPSTAERPVNPPESDLTEREQIARETETFDAAQCGGWWEERLRENDSARCYAAAAMACLAQGLTSGAEDMMHRAVDEASREVLEGKRDAD